MNNVNMTGRWVADVTERAVGEKKKAEGRIAVSTFKKDVSHFFDVEMWDKTAEIAAQYCKKGDFAIVSGRLAQDVWEKDGEKRSKVYIVAERIDLPPKTEGKGDASSSSASTPADKPKAKAKPAAAPAAEDEDPDLF